MEDVIRVTESASSIYDERNVYSLVGTLVYFFFFSFYCTIYYHPNLYLNTTFNTETRRAQAS